MRTETRLNHPTRELKILQFKMSNKCQLTCAHCGPDRSSGWAKLLNISPHVINAFEVTDIFLEELVKILPQLEVIKFTGGEPFLDPNHWKILEHLQSYDRSHCTLQYITNGISPARGELWHGW
jgi:MoaA/NifB/PqqE/SkfB family radical SAM enzyme